MKILVIPSWYPPYGGEFFQAQVEGLLKLGQNVEVLSIERVSPKDIITWLKALFLLFFSNYQVRNENGVVVIVSEVPGIPFFDKLYAKLFASKGCRVFKKYSKKSKFIPDIIHVHSLIWAGLTAAKIKLKFNIPYVVTEHRGRFSNNDFVSRQQKNEMALLEVKIAANHASKILCVSSVLSPYLKSIAPEVKIEILPNLVNTNQFNVGTISPNKGTVFICVGSLIPLKGHACLIRAFHKITEVDDHLYIVGSGELLTELKALCEELTIGSQVTFVGHATPSQVADYLKRSDIFVLPSQYESFGVVFIEAMSVGLPVIGSKGTGAVDFVTEQNGRLVEPDNYEELAKAMLYIKKHRSEFDADAISLNVREQFQEKVIINRLIEHLSTVKAEVL